MTLNRTLERSRAIFRVRPFANQECLGFRRTFESESWLRPHQLDSLAKLRQLDIENGLQLNRAQCMKNGNLVDPVHELWRKELSRRREGDRVVSLVRLL